MNDIDFKRLASLLFAYRLIGKVVDPVESAVDMANRLFKKLQDEE